MKLVVCVKSCQRDLELHHHDAIRQTWGKDAKALGIEVRFFVAASMNKYQPDEVHLKCPDDYDGLPFKTRAICQWLQGKTFDFAFLCDNDTFLKPDKLLQTGFEKFDYSGRFGSEHPIGIPFNYTDHRGSYPLIWPWASGGVGYFLSRRAIDIVAETYPLHWAEDVSVAQALGPNGDIKIGDLDLDGVASWHLQKTRRYPVYQPQYMQEVYKLGDPNIFYQRERQAALKAAGRL